MRFPSSVIAWPLLAALIVLGSATSACAEQTVSVGAGDTLTIGGFVSATMLYDWGLFGAFGQGQNAEYAAAPGSQPKTDKSFLDGDVRNTRLNFGFKAGPIVGSWAPHALVEADFFGGQDAPPFGDEQPRMRLRLAYADLTNGRTTVRIGQYWAPLFAEVPVSLSHIAFPLGYGAAGMIGWRFPGVFLYQKLGTSEAMNTDLQLAVMKGAGPPVGASDVANAIGDGEASGLPQIEARFNVGGKAEKLDWLAYAVGHVDWKDTTGTGVRGGNQTAWAVEAGMKVAPGSLTLHGNAYYGRGIGENFAFITQQGDVRGWGGWAQLGYSLTKSLDFWAFYGVEQPDVKRFEEDHPNQPPLLRHRNVSTNAMLRYHAGRYALGVEWYKAMTRWNTGRSFADQYTLSVMYTL